AAILRHGRLRRPAQDEGVAAEYGSRTGTELGCCRSSALLMLNPASAGLRCAFRDMQLHPSAPSGTCDPASPHKFLPSLNGRLEKPGLFCGPSKGLFSLGLGTGLWISHLSAGFSSRLPLWAGSRSREAIRVCSWIRTPPLSCS